MRKTILVLMMLLGVSIYSMAQSYIDVLYLKDGSRIRGQIIEQVPDQSLKIQTYDGSLFVYSMDQVEKIVKEAVGDRRAVRGENFGRAPKKRSTLRGYKGFIDGGYTVGDDDRIEFSTTHGYQFNNYIFLGGGIGYNYYPDLDANNTPIFANFRVNFTNRKITPFGDAKFGYSAGDLEGAYGSIGVGVRFSLGVRTALNLSLSYSIQSYDYYSYDYNYDYWDYYDYSSTGGLSLKIGFEF